MSYATAAPAHFPYLHRTVEQVDRDHARSAASYQLKKEMKRQQRAKPDGVRAL